MLQVNHRFVYNLIIKLYQSHSSLLKQNWIIFNLEIYTQYMKKTLFICQECGSIHNKWSGRCSDCDAWNSLHEEIIEKKELKSFINQDLKVENLSDEASESSRISTSIAEFDRVLGGGLVNGSAILIGGDPGIGKSTILLQLVAQMSNKKLECIYISGEESTEQIKIRAKRLGIVGSSVKLVSCTNLQEIKNFLSKEKKTNLVVLDSIQTLFSSEYSSAAGTVTQVKACASELISFGKENNVIILIVGHVTKDGQIAGPKVLEHMVDTVLYFEGERGDQFRILRAVKNRFGGVNEIGIFEMRDSGLVEISNPSELFLTPGGKNVTGSVIFAGIEGSRPLLVEIQALAANSFMPTPRRSVVGWDINKLSMLTAVISVRYGLNISNKEIYLNVVGGIKISEPAVDLAVICALISSATNIPVKEKTIVFGEVGLSGEVRKVTQIDKRLKEAEKLGFTRAIIPMGTDYSNSNLDVIEIGHIKQLKDIFIQKSTKENC
jgi:DNA repair protein RadA/Sms